MKNRVPSNCPVCGGDYEISKLTCEQCKSELAGHFHGCEFCSLNDEDMYFALTFIQCRGNIKDVEKALGISYPTVRRKLDGVIEKLGLSASRSEEEIKLERQKVFQRLSDGEITADEAVELIKGL